MHKGTLVQLKHEGVHEDLLSGLGGWWVVAEGAQMGGRHLVNHILAPSFNHIVSLANAPVRAGRSKGLKVPNAILGDGDAGTLPCREAGKQVLRSVKERLQERRGK